MAGKDGTGTERFLVVLPGGEKGAVNQAKGRRQFVQEHLIQQNPGIVVLFSRQDRNLLPDLDLDPWPGDSDFCPRLMRNAKRAGPLNPVKYT